MAGAPYLVYFGFRVAVLFSIGNPGIHYSGYWGTGVLEYWSIGVLEYWSIGFT